MSNLSKLPTFVEDDKTIVGAAAIRCVVEAPRGSPVKFRYDPDLKAFVLGHSLIKGLSYPFDWGFIPSTLGEDGDPLDIMIIHDCPTFSGLVITAQLIGVLETVQYEGKSKVANHRFFAVPVHSHREDELNDVRQLSKRLRKELERFFKDTAALEEKEVEFIGWKNPERARHLLDEGIKRREKQQG